MHIQVYLDIGTLHLHQKINGTLNNDPFLKNYSINYFLIFLTSQNIHIRSEHTC